MIYMPCLATTGDDDPPWYGPYGSIIGMAFFGIFIRFRKAHHLRIQKRVSLALLLDGMKTPYFRALVHDGLYFNCETDHSVQPKVA